MVEAAQPPRGTREGGASTDPNLSANLYAASVLDSAALEVLVPLRSELEALPDEALLWAMRYARNGEHLKIRIHLPESEVDAIRSRMLSLTEGFFGRLPPADDEARRPSRSESPPIDGRDFGDEPAPDRSLDFTDYRLTKISFGGEPYLEDPAYRGLMVRAFDRGCSMFLSELADQRAVIDHPRRQRLMWRAMIQAAYALGLSPQETAAYAAYHRDWLIRSPLLREGKEEDQGQEYIENLERLASRNAGAVEVLRESIAVEGPREPVPDTPWGATLLRIARHVDGRYDDSGIQLDPFAAQPFFPPLIKVLHGFANLIGLKRLDQAFALHLIVRAAAENLEPFQRIHLTPP
ncbi:MAG: hypothetical protein AAF481_16035 [Acidobacteriota bacterium]